MRSESVIESLSLGNLQKWEDFLYYTERTLQTTHFALALETDAS